MAKYAQSRNDRLDESLGMRRGPEKDFSQSFKDRRDESRGAKKAMDRREEKRGDRYGANKGGTFDIPDNQHSFEMRYVPTDAEQYDLNRIKPYKQGSKGYPAEAWNYKF